MRKLIRALAIVIGLQLLGACSNEQLYNSQQGAREQECEQITDIARRNLCLDDAHKSYARFEYERSESRNQK